MVQLVYGHNLQGSHKGVLNMYLRLRLQRTSRVPLLGNEIPEKPHSLVIV